MTEIVRGSSLQAEGARRVYRLTYRCPSDGVVTAYFDAPVHKTGEDCDVRCTISKLHGQPVHEEHDHRFDNHNLRWNPTFDVIADEVLQYECVVELHNAEYPHDAWIFQLNFEAKVPAETK